MTDEQITNMDEIERRYYQHPVVMLESADGQIVTVRADAERIISRMIRVGYVIVPTGQGGAGESVKHEG